MSHIGHPLKQLHAMSGRRLWLDNGPISYTFTAALCKIVCYPGTRVHISVPAVQHMECGSRWSMSRYGQQMLSRE